MDLVIDIGFSKAYCSLLGEQLERPRVLRRGSKDPLVWVDDIIISLQEELSEVDRISIATAGLVSQSGTDYFLGQKNDLAAKFKKATRSKVSFINDGQAAALAARALGYQIPLLSFHVGTGVAFGVINDTLYKGFHGYAGEAGVDLGGKAISKLYQRKTKEKFSAKEVILKETKNDAIARSVLLDVREQFIQFVVQSWLLFDPAVIVFSGGEIFNYYKKDLHLDLLEKLLSLPYGDLFSRNVDIHYSPLGSFAPLIGAALALKSDLDFGYFL